MRGGENAEWSIVLGEVEECKQRREIYVRFMPFHPPGHFGRGAHNCHIHREVIIIVVVVIIIIMN
jgi:hypothetical protein